MTGLAMTVTLAARNAAPSPLLPQTSEKLWGVASLVLLLVLLTVLVAATWATVRRAGRRRSHPSGS